MNALDKIVIKYHDALRFFIMSATTVQTYY